MVNKCCVANCKSNYVGNSEKGYVTCFKFPTDKTLQEKWLRKIPREELNVSKYTVVCIKHFQECDIIKYDILPGKNGDPDIKIARKQFAFRKDVFPCIFPTYVLTCHLQLPLYDAPSHQNVANEMKNTMKLCKNNGLTLTKLLHINYVLKDYVVFVVVVA